jgi:hypothetical protein
MTDTDARTPTLPHHDHLARLVASRAITEFQAEWIRAIGPNLDAQAFAHPYLSDLREHTRAYLERAGQSCP